VHDRWQRVVDFAHERGIKIDLGVVANSLEGDKPAYFQWIKDQRATGRVGFWWHGWDHAEWKEGEKRLFEFGGTSYEHQRKHLEDSQRLAREKLGFPFVAFGAPFNVTDATTVRVLGEDKELRVWMYGPPDATADKIVLGRAFAVNIEQPTFVANYPEFIEGYAHNRGAGYFVIQGHPMQWNDERFDHFTRIIDFLIGQRAEFVFAEEFASRPELAGRAAR
jgi:peptidoglycan/xylan/chitin deacetylase (PgdA/CDA1 family)